MSEPADQTSPTTDAPTAAARTTDSWRPRRTLWGWGILDWAIMIGFIAAMTLIYVPWMDGVAVSERNVRVFVGGTLLMMVARGVRHRFDVAAEAALRERAGEIQGEIPRGAAMSPAQVFGIIVRVVGLGVTMVSIPWVYDAYSKLGILFPVPSGPLKFAGHQTTYSVNWPLIHYFVLFLVGLWMLRGARSLVAFAYPEEFPTVRPRDEQPDGPQ